MPTEPSDKADPRYSDAGTEHPGKAAHTGKPRKDPETGNSEAVEHSEADPADAAEQRKDLTPQEDDPLTGIDPAKANEADASEQARVVPVDEDDYR
ncbi:hypothetical protein OG760_24655 [Streptomyces sp. NBC_00963]|uniref:hypothetical protein n=1 Tax=Streptomyces sp. NBC_01306 TaxID=2903819 RepID=UPI00224FBEF9|nr:hypothetical protein [Streptomyces sp. NBC_01306]MCX4723944.1 hypothetical protein [Streptomyces sp. NBC_01306]WSX44632.1 hypothetical protein OG760_24655 [Streptomyces sp. NBC_00963]